MSIRRKIQITMIIVAVVCSIAYGSLVVLTMNSFAGKANDNLLNNASGLCATLLDEHRDSATRASTLAAENENLINYLMDVLAGGDRQSLINTSASIMKATAVDFLTVLDTQGNVIVRAHEPDNFGDSLANQANIQHAMAGTQYTTTEKGTAVLLSVRCGTPIYDHDNNLIGVVSLGFRLDQDGFVDYVKKMTGAETTVFLGDTRVSTTVLNDKGERAVGTTASETVSATVLAGNDYIGRADVLGKSLLAHYTPIRDAENVVLGMLFVGVDTSSTDAHIRQNLTIFAIDTVALLVAAWFGSMYVSGRIANPIRKMSIAAKHLAEGDVDVEIDVENKPRTKDETIHLGQAFGEMIQANQRRAALITGIAHGDLSGSIEPISEKDVVGTALAMLLDMNNDSFGNITNAAVQLDMASNQVADGAQNLAQSATEQAAIIERLQFTLTELSAKSMEKAGRAKEASALSESVKGLAEKGSLQMEQMMDAVEQISKASESIGKVIKVIDDIAFQTNILALNAAVEAARAGQHGKGFAVVAEEVRNLASKSAAAAKDTGTLIANSIEKAKLGAQISAETSASFTEIVNGVNKSSGIIEDIADFIQVQNKDILNVTKGVDEIGSVVHSVSAAAEESSASSEEMSAQATAMAATLAEYKLRDNGPQGLNTAHPIALPPKP